MEVEILGHYYHITAWTSCGSGMCVCFGMFIMNDGALRAVKKLYIRLCAARDIKTLLLHLNYYCFALTSIAANSTAHCNLVFSAFLFSPAKLYNSAPITLIRTITTSFIGLRLSSYD
jgi:hypothetical protein